MSEVFLGWHESLAADTKKGESHTNRIQNIELYSPFEYQLRQKDQKYLHPPYAGWESADHLCCPREWQILPASSLPGVRRLR